MSPAANFQMFKIRGPSLSDDDERQQPGNRPAGYHLVFGLNSVIFCPDRKSALNSCDRADKCCRFIELRIFDVRIWQFAFARVPPFYSFCSLHDVDRSVKERAGGWVILSTDRW